MEISRNREPGNQGRPPGFAARRISKVDSERELADIEDEIDDILKAQRAMAASGDENAVDASTLNIAAHRL